MYSHAIVLADEMKREQFLRDEAAARVLITDIPAFRARIQRVLQPSPLGMHATGNKPSYFARSVEATGTNQKSASLLAQRTALVYDIPECNSLITPRDTPTTS